jgi:hypothetical protein
VADLLTVSTLVIRIRDKPTGGAGAAVTVTASSCKGAERGDRTVTKVNSIKNYFKGIDQ